jgi:type IX secretion system PorP/SprF family membrane protein
MKRLYVILFLLAFTGGAQCQQLPFYTQYVLNPFITNPALAGIEDYWDLKLSYRSQWQGIAGAPKTVYLTFQGPIKHIPYGKPTPSTIYRNDARRKFDEAKYWKQWMSHKAIVPHAGLGFTVLSDKAGPIHRYAVNASYAYHIGLSSNTSISAGISGGVQGISLDPGALDFGVNNPSDPTLGNVSETSEVRPDINFGLYLYSGAYFIGASAQNLVSSRLSYSGLGNDTLVTHYLASAGYKASLNSDLTLLPSVMFRFVPATPVSFDVNAKMQYRDLAWAGASYRYQSGFAGMVGFSLSSRMNFGYSFDLSGMNGLPYMRTATHEVILGLLFRNASHARCPSDYW